MNRILGLVVVLLMARCAGAQQEITSAAEFEVLRQSPRAAMVEFYSGMCGYCRTFKPTWQKLVEQASRLETARVNIDEDAGMDIAQRLGVLDLGIPAVVLFNSEGTDYETLMAGELYPLSRLLKRVYHRTRGLNLALDDRGFFLKQRTAVLQRPRR